MWKLFSMFLMFLNKNSEKCFSLYSMKDEEKERLSFFPEKESDINPNTLSWKIKQEYDFLKYKYGNVDAQLFYEWRALDDMWLTKEEFLEIYEICVGSKESNCNVLQFIEMNNIIF